MTRGEIWRTGLKKKREKRSIWELNPRLKKKVAIQSVKVLERPDVLMSNLASSRLGFPNCQASDVPLKGLSHTPSWKQLLKKKFLYHIISCENWKKYQNLEINHHWKTTWTYLQLCCNASCTYDHVAAKPSIPSYRTSSLPFGSAAHQRVTLHNRSCLFFLFR